MYSCGTQARSTMAHNSERHEQYRQAGQGDFGARNGTNQVRKEAAIRCTACVYAILIA
jgi:hypothetical protein